jgi:hypothetical protein
MATAELSGNRSTRLEPRLADRHNIAPGVLVDLAERDCDDNPSVLEYSSK